jgi:hypothetical protein
MDTSLALAKEIGDCSTDAFLHRLRGDILLKRDAAKPALAEEAFKTAIVIAKGARSHVLLAPLPPSSIKRQAAPLKRRPSWCRRSREMPEITEALALMERLRRVALHADSDR